MPLKAGILLHNNSLCKASKQGYDLPLATLAVPEYISLISEWPGISYMQLCLYEMGVIALMYGMSRILMKH